MRQITALEKNVFNYLNDLRESGETNMYGARPYIMDEFKIKSKEATRILLLWMKNFKKEGLYETIDDL